MHAISSYRGNRPTNKHTHKHTDMTYYNILRRSFASAQCNNLVITVSHSTEVYSEVPSILLGTAELIEELRESTE